METLKRWNAALEKQNTQLIGQLVDHTRLKLVVETENLHLKNEIHRLLDIITRLEKEKQTANDRTVELSQECHKLNLSIVELVGENMKSEEEIDRLRLDLALNDQNFS